MQNQDSLNLKFHENMFQNNESISGNQISWSEIFPILRFFQAFEK